MSAWANAGDVRLARMVEQAKAEPRWSVPLPATALRTSARAFQRPVRPLDCEADGIVTASRWTQVKVRKNGRETLERKDQWSSVAWET